MISLEEPSVTGKTLFTTRASVHKIEDNNNTFFFSISPPLCNLVNQSSYDFKILMPIAFNSDIGISFEFEFFLLPLQPP